MANSSKQASDSLSAGGIAANVGDVQDKQTLTDRDLVIAYQAGDRAAYNAIYDRHAERVRRICYRMLGNSADAEEAAQETFLRCYRALGRFNGQYQLGAWVSRVASNVCLDQLRLRGRSVKTQDADDEVAELVCTAKQPDLVVEQQIDVAESLRGIQPLHARALMLRAVAGLSHQEIASELKMTPDQVKALLHRARISFRRVWNQASGWVLAPFGLRLPFAKKEGAPAGDGINFLATSPMTTTLVERMAASAMIAALALTGASAVESFSTPSSPGAVAGPSLPEYAEIEKDPLPTRAERFSDSGGANPDGAKRASRRSAPAPKEEPLVAFGGVVVQRPEAPPTEHEEELNPVPAGATAADKAKRKLSRIVNEVRETARPAPSQDR